MLGVEAEQVQHGGLQVHADPVLVDSRAQVVGGAVDVADLHAAAGSQMEKASG